MALQELRPPLRSRHVAGRSTDRSTRRQVSRIQLLPAEPCPGTVRALQSGRPLHEGGTAMETSALVASVTATLIAVAWKIAGALLLWLAGRWLIGFAVRLLSRALANQRFDTTLSRYLQTGLSVLLNVALIVAMLGFFGVETTTFAALLAAGGVGLRRARGGPVHKLPRRGSL